MAEKIVAKKNGLQRETPGRPVGVSHRRTRDIIELMYVVVNRSGHGVMAFRLLHVAGLECRELPHPNPLP